MSSSFYAMLSRMKYISRWSLMRNTQPENICEHSYEVAVIAHALALLTNRRFGGQVREDRCVLLALYHDTTEIITGDLPTPVKYYNPAIRDAYREVENVATEKLLSMLPEDLRDAYQPVLSPQPAKSSRTVAMPLAARSSARGAKWPSPCRLPVKPWHSTTSGSSSPRADLAGSWMVAGILPRVPGISMFFGLVLGCNSVTAATMHSAMAAKQASRIQGARVFLACFIWVPLSGFFRFIVLSLKRIQGGLSIVSCSSPLI